MDIGIGHPGPVGSLDPVGLQRAQLLSTGIRIHAVEHDPEQTAALPACVALRQLLYPRPVVSADGEA